MANRVIRDWTTSDSMDKLSSGAEVFFTRLIMKADDFGSYFANPKLLKSGLFPLKDISEGTVKGWVHECVSAGLIFKYTVAGKEYIRIDNFGQRLRNMRNAFPHPDDNSQQLAANRGESRPETKRNETETEVETESEAPLRVLSKDGLDLVDAVCNYFDVRAVLTSPAYNSVYSFVETLQHRNELQIAGLALQKYMSYKARSQEVKHNVLKWIGTKDNHYRDGHWFTTDWNLKDRNYKQPNERAKEISGQSSPEPGKDYHSERL